ncbi:helix-turn-helix domain-containing protein [Microbispora bryophytorum]|uniref:helix-turn-helix domain-containing protein n=1 Tax=Microbispora bryophytorum TaxID=1460882 RepID=UPI00371D0378
MLAETGTCALELEMDDDGVFRRRLEQWRFGAITMHATHGSGMRYWQTARHLRMDSWNIVSVMTQSVGRGGFIWNDLQQSVTRDELVVTNKSAGYWEYNWAGFGSALAFMFDLDEVALPERMVHSAVPRVIHSSVTPLLLSHLRLLHRNADRLESQPDVESIGESTVALVRALVASVGADQSTRQDVAEETRLVRILAYIRAHITDPDLTPQHLAQVHNISLRSLYRLCEDGGLSLEKWIIRRRLDGARQDLTSPEHAHRTIDAIALSWGFTHPSHFSRRFRDTYGITPRDARRKIVNAPNPPISGT